MKNKPFILLSLLLLFAGAHGAAAQSGGTYNLRWHTIDGGGGRCSGGAFTLHGTIGQPESGVVMRSDLPTLTAALDPADTAPMGETTFAVHGGFWPGLVELPGHPPTLTLELDSLNHVTLTWPYPSSGYVLQQTANLNALGGGWTSFPGSPVIVGTNWQVGRVVTSPALMFRLQKPSSVRQVP
jgi:hypothetical protein